MTMTLPLTPLQGTNEPSVLGPFMDLLGRLFDQFWWAGVLLLVLLAVRAYIDHANETQGDYDAQGLRAVVLFFISSSYGLLFAIGGTLLYVFLKIANILQFTPFVAWGIGSGDPVTLGSIAAGLVAAAAAFDLPWATLSNTVLAFGAVAGGLIVLDSLQSASEAVDDDDEDDD